MKRLAAILIVASGCTLDGTGAKQRVFTCTSDSDCAAGFACIAGLCANGDGGEIDGGPRGDAGHPADAGGSDAGALDAGSRDAGGVGDSGAKDAGSADAGSSDAGCNLMAINCALPACNGATCLAHGFVCSGGLCKCSGNGGVAEVVETACGDGFDNDCNGLTDCADPNCLALSCGANGLVCASNACVCGGNGGVPQPTETACSDGHDNDCNGLTDCADPSCNTLACGANGRFCDGGSCRCEGNGGVAQATETICNDGRDNDCNGLIDCADPNCVAQTCGPNGRTCSAGSCQCGGNGGVAQAAETICNDGFDNDCNGLTDCADPNCAGQPCGPNGETCTAMGVCPCIPPDGGIGETIETLCMDGVDNDCNGKTDCADPNCQNNHYACSPQYTFRGCQLDAGCGFACEGFGHPGCTPGSTSGNNCCGGYCGPNGECAAVNTSNAGCSDLGQGCATNANCCSAYCSGGLCAVNPSPHTPVACLTGGQLVDLCAPPGTNMLPVVSGCDPCVTALCKNDPDLCCSTTAGAYWDPTGCAAYADEYCRGRCN